MGDLKEDFSETGWRIWSTRDSIERGSLSVTAILETVLAVIVYWWVSIKFETFAPLVISAAIAPLVLLRSHKSVERGLLYFNNWRRRLSCAKKSDLSAFFIYLYTVIFLLVAIVNCSQLLQGIQAILNNVNNSRNIFEFFRLFIGNHPTIVVGDIIIDVGVNTLALLLTWMVFAEGSAFIIAGFTSIRILPSLRSVSFCALGLLLFIIVLIVVRNVTFIDYVVFSRNNTIFIMLTFYAIFLIVKNNDPGSTTSFVRVIEIPLYLGRSFGIFCVALAVRIAATLFHFRDGWRRISHNFCQLVFCTSPLQVPELVPGEKVYTFRSVYQAFKGNIRSREFQKIIIAVGYFLPGMFLWFFPAWFYRFTLKSTAWFWWPLAYLRGDLRCSMHPELLHQKTLKTLWAKTTIVFALLTLAGFVLYNILNSWILSNKLISVLSPIEFIFLLDWKIRPWQVFSVLSAALSVGIVFWIDIVDRDYTYAQAKQESEMLERARRQFGHIERLARCRSVAVLGFLILVGYHTLLVFNAQKCWFELPANVQNWTAWVYTDRMPVKTCVSGSSVRWNVFEGWQTQSSGDNR